VILCNSKGVVFGATFRDFWENFIFIWQVRPFDVGDKVVVDAYPTLVIHRIHLMYTEVTIAMTLQK
jgi:predicted methyltransferase